MCFFDFVQIFVSDVKELTQKCIGGQELQQEKVKIQALSDETANSLKKNVYQNYMQFIETAKEISRILWINDLEGLCSYVKSTKIFMSFKCFIENWLNLLY